MAVIFEFLSEAWMPTALGLVVAIPALWGYWYLTGRLKDFDREMENASLDLANQLVLCQGRFRAMR